MVTVGLPILAIVVHILWRIRCSFEISFATESHVQVSLIPCQQCPTKVILETINHRLIVVSIWGHFSAEHHQMEPWEVIPFVLHEVGYFNFWGITRSSTKNMSSRLNMLKPCISLNRFSKSWLFSTTSSNWEWSIFVIRWAPLESGTFLVNWGFPSSMWTLGFLYTIGILLNNGTCISWGWVGTATCGGGYSRGRSYIRLVTTVKPYRGQTLFTTACWRLFFVIASTTFIIWSTWSFKTSTFPLIFTLPCFKFSNSL